MLMKSDGAPQDWKETVNGIITLGKFLSLKRDQLSSEQFRTFVRADIELDESSAMKLIKLAEHPIISNPDYYHLLPPAWGKLYELRFLPNDVLLAGIKDGSLKDATKYQVWALRGIKKRNSGHVATLQPGRVQVPTDTTLYDYCLTGIEIEKSTNADPVDVAKKLGIGVQTYRLIKSIHALYERPELSASDKELVASTIAKINRTRNVRTYYPLIKPLIEKVWGGGRNRFYDDRSMQKRIEAFRTAVTIVCDTCERAAGVEQPLMPTEDIDASINQLTEARKIIGQITENLRRARND